MKWFGGDMKDIKDIGSSATEDKEVAQIVKSYSKKSSKNSGYKTESKLKKSMKAQSQKRKERKSAKEEFGSTTSDDIAKNRRGKLWGYVWKFLAITFLFIIILAAVKVMNTGIREAPKTKEKKKVLEGLEIEDADYFQSRTVAQITELAGELKKIKEQEQKKDEASRQALIEEAKKNKALLDKIQILETKLEEKDRNDTKASVSDLVSAQVGELKKKLDSLLSRPSPSNVSRGIAPLPGNSDEDRDDILVDAKKKSPAPTKEEKKKIKERVKRASKAIQKEYEYEDVSIEVMSVDEGIMDHHMVADKEKKIPVFHIMTGFAKATLITGVAAPTFGGGKANPVPVILSLISNEIIANGFDANINDCMLIGQAFGNMNTMRAEIEVTRISCNVEKDGKLYKIEEGVKAWIYGENGIHGLRGRLVDSAGKILTKELAVGFLQGVATAFAQPKSTIQTAGGIPTQIFESGNIKDAAYRGVAQGSSNALNNLSEYYTKLLDGAYPFVSIRSGRTVTVLFKGGEDIKMTPYSRVNVDSDIDGFGFEKKMEIDTNGW